jgi:hypothetical protein
LPLAQSSGFTHTFGAWSKYRQRSESSTPMQIGRSPRTSCCAIVRP